MALAASYPARVEATLDAPLSRWLWLVKWLLAVPHYVLLFFLWVAFVMVSMVAFVAILFTGRYPPGLFDFNVGVLRWSWRVAYYTYGALGTDRYPPFTLADVPDYPAHFDIDYPAHLSRGLVLVKWWLLAIPQYLIVGVFAGGGAWAAWRTDHGAAAWGPGGLIGLLVVIAAIALTVTGRYPRQLFDFVLGLNRWVLRVAAYAGLMTDQYPPFRLDMGGHEASAVMTLPSPPAPPGVPEPSALPSPPIRPSQVPGWTGLRIVSVVAGCLVGLMSIGLLAAGGGATWLDNTQRDSAGYLTSGLHSLATTSYAMTSDRIDLGTSDLSAPAAILGTVRFRVTATDPTKAVFVGIAPKGSADSYLAGVGRVTVPNWAGSPRYRGQPGGPPSVPPAASSIWVASVAGAGTQTLTWKPAGGDWVVVIMNADAGAGVSVTADAGATFPPLGWIAGGLLAGGGVLLVVGLLLVVFPVVRAGRPAGARR